MMTFAYVDPNLADLREAEHDLIAADAAHMALTDDGHDYEFRDDAPDETALYVSDGSRNGPQGLGEFRLAYDGPAGAHLPLIEYGGTRQQRIDRLYERVCYAPWSDVITEADYRRTLAEAEVDV